MKRRFCSSLFVILFSKVILSQLSEYYIVQPDLYYSFKIHQNIPECKEATYFISKKDIEQMIKAYLDIFSVYIFDIVFYCPRNLDRHIEETGLNRFYFVTVYRYHTWLNSRSSYSTDSTDHVLLEKGNHRIGYQYFKSLHSLHFLTLHFSFIVKERKL